MKVAHVVHAMVVGGAEMLVANLARSAVARGEEAPVILCLDAVGPLGEALRAEGHEVECIGRVPGIDRRLAGKLTARLQAHGVDVVHCHQYTPWFYGGIAAARAGLPVVFTEHGRHQPDRPRWRRVLFNQWLYRKTGAITAVSESIRSALVDNERVPSGRIEVLYNGIDPERFRPDAQERLSVREELGVAPDECLVLTAGRLFEIKNQRMLLRAAQSLVEQGRGGLRIFIAGAGPLDRELKSEAALMDLGDRVVFLGERDDVPRLLQGADIFTLTSWSEGTSITLLEAMSSGLPVVVTAVGGNPELVEEGQQGHLVPSDDHQQLAAALLRLQASPSSRADMGAAGRRRVLDRFTFEGMRSRFEAIYREVAPR